MQALFEAIEDRFKADADVVTTCRRLYQGSDDRSERGVLPYADVQFFGPASADTFGEDVDEYTVRLMVFTRKLQARRAHESKEHMMRVYDKADLIHGVFHTVMCERTAADGPRLRDGVYQSSLDYRVVIQRTALVPALRYA